MSEEMRRLMSGKMQIGWVLRNGLLSVGRNDDAKPNGGDCRLEFGAPK